MKTVRMVARLAFCALVIVICVGSLLPQGHTVPVGHFDKVIHFGAYALTAFCGTLGSGSWRGRLAVILAMAALGGVIEVLQAFVPGRSESVGDFLADVLGTITGVVLADASLRRLWPAIRPLAGRAAE